MAKLTKNLAPLFDSSISYEPGERFMYGDHMYEALEPLSGAFDSTKVSEVTLADIFKGVSSNDVKCLAPEYDVNTEYSVENLVLHDGVLYECVEATTGPFDETKWSRKYLSDVGGLNSNLVIFNSFEELLSYSNTGSTYSFTYTATETGYLFANMWCNSKSMTYTETVADGAKVSVSLETIDTSSWETAGTNKLYMIYMPKGSTTTIKCTHNNGSTMRIVASAGFASN